MYVVSYQVGTSGTFIAGLIWNWLLDYNKEFDFSYFGNSHKNTEFSDNWVPMPDPYSHTANTRKVEIVDSSKPLILSTHSIPDYPQLKEWYDDVNVINITYTDRDKPHLSANWFYKVIVAQIVQPEDTVKYNYSMYLWEFLQHETGIHKHISELTLDECKIAIEAWMNHKDSLNVPAENIKDGVYFITNGPNDTSIRFHDIISNKERVLDQLSNLLKKPVTPWVHHTYDKYIEVQRQLIMTKAPWLSDHVFSEPR